MQQQTRTRRTINEFGIDFMGARRIMTIISATFIVISLLAIVIRGFNFGLDFTGGTVIEVGYEQPAELTDIRTALEDAGLNGATIQYFGSQHDVLIRLPPDAVRQGGQSTGAEADSTTGIEENASSRLSDYVFGVLSKGASSTVELRRVEFVGPQVGEELREQGGLAVLFTLIGILVYVAMRFQWRFGIGAVGSLINDVIFVLGIFAIFQIPFDLTVLAAVLAVIGYSLNDTIVIFDRIRENFRRMRKGSVVTIVNDAINQTLSRTIITSGTTLVVLLALYLFGGEALKGFSLALLLGIITGTYSTIYIATSLTLWLGLSRADMIAPKKEAEAGAQV